MSLAEREDMKEFVGKLIKQLEERIQDNNGWEDDEFFGGQSNAFEWTISVIKKLEEEYSNDFCEWKIKSWGLFPINTSCENSLDVNYNYEFCPYCGKKIKVVE